MNIKVAAYIVTYLSNFNSGKATFSLENHLTFQSVFISSFFQPRQTSTSMLVIIRQLVLLDTITKIPGDTL